MMALEQNKTKQKKKHNNNKKNPQHSKLSRQNYLKVLFLFMTA